ncbi:unnamed protein product [Musa banksii]
MEKLILLLCLASAIFRCFSSSAECKPQVDGGGNGTVRVRVGAVLDMQTLEGKRNQASINMAMDDFYAAHGNYSTRVDLCLRDSNTSIIGAAAAATELLDDDGVQVIIGPPTSTQADYVLVLGNHSRVPILSFSATSPSLSTARTPYFVRTTLNDSSEVGAIAAVVKSFGWRNVIPVYDDTDYGTGAIPYLVDALHAVDAAVPYRSIIVSTASDEQIEKELYRLMTMQTRVFIVHMLADLGSRLMRKAKEVGMMVEGYVWITTDGITNELDLLEEKVLNSMHGTVGVRRYINRSDEGVRRFTKRFTEKFAQGNPSVNMSVQPHVFDFWAYDTAWAVAMAVERAAGAMRPRIRGSPSRSSVATDLDKLDVAIDGPRLLKAIHDTRFRGLCGEFLLVDGQLPVSAFEIVNVDGDHGGRETVIGYWKPESGITRHPNTNKATELMPIVWPGGSTTVPKGWQIPTNGKKLQVIVPVTTGFKRFLSVEWDPTKNSTSVKGYCIDVFDAVMKSLPYAVPYEYILLQPRTASYIDDLVYQIYLKVILPPSSSDHSLDLRPESKDVPHSLLQVQNYDALVGDITIVANRSQYVDFTLPYTESGVSMVVPLKKKPGNALIFLKPLSADLWISCIFFTFLTGFVVWLFEHRDNTGEFGGPLHRQLGIIFCFVCSTLVSSPERKLKSTASQIVVVFWASVVLILVSSYTAMLSSMLTVQELQPTVSDVTELQTKGVYVGYRNGSFVADLLQKMNFDRHRLRNYSTVDQYADALSKGSDNGGVAAIFDEIPYLMFFLSKHCLDYTMVGPTHQTAGFGFVFQKGSPLVADVSRAILKVTQGDKMVEIKRKWFGDRPTCSSQQDNLSSMRLNFRNFWGLFLISGLVSITALAYFVYNNPYEAKEVMAMMQQTIVYIKGGKLDKEAQSVTEPDQNG